MELQKILDMPQVTADGDLHEIITARSKDVGHLIFALMSKKPKWTYEITSNDLKVFEGKERLGTVKILYGEFLVKNKRIECKLKRSRKYIQTSSVGRVVREVTKYFYPRTPDEVISGVMPTPHILYRDIPLLKDAENVFRSLADKVTEHMTKDILAFKDYLGSFSFSDEQLLQYAEERQRIDKVKSLRYSGDNSGYRVIEMPTGKLVIHNHATDAKYFADEIPTPLKAKYGMLKMGEYDHFYLGVGLKTQKTDYLGEQDITTYYIQETDDE